MINFELYGSDVQPLIEVGENLRETGIGAESVFTNYDSIPSIRTEMYGNTLELIGSVEPEALNGLAAMLGLKSEFECAFPEGASIRVKVRDDAGASSVDIRGRYFGPLYSVKSFGLGILPSEILPDLTGLFEHGLHRTLIDKTSAQAIEAVEASTVLTTPDILACAGSFLIEVANKARY